MKTHSIYRPRTSGSAWILGPGVSLSSAEFWQRSANWSQQLPENGYCILLCEDRANFVLGFTAALGRKQTIILPANKTPVELDTLVDRYPGSYLLVDGETENYKGHRLDCRTFDVNLDVPAIPAVLDDRHLAALVFTSGSTGEPSANEKYWGDLVRSTDNVKNRFGFDEDDYIVATVPAQHMYGLETSVLAPLLTGAKIFSGRPFFPLDVLGALNQGKDKQTLVTTPIHLRACVEADFEWPQIKQIISATAPLDPEIARKAEERFRCPVMEIYGCTEAGSLATRRTVEQNHWTMYEGMEIYSRDGAALIRGSHLPSDIALADSIRIENPSSFQLLGRQDDMIKIGGKRASLKDLNIKLNSIPGVIDGVFVLPADRNPGSTTRLVALVVAPELSESDVITALSRMIDRVFLPRPLYRVESLPRNETQKLPRKAVNELLAKLNCP